LSNKYQIIWKVDKRFIQDTLKLPIIRNICRQISNKLFLMIKQKHKSKKNKSNQRQKMEQHDNRDSKKDFNIESKQKTEASQKVRRFLESICEDYFIIELSKQEEEYDPLTMEEDCPLARN